MILFTVWQDFVVFALSEKGSNEEEIWRI